MIRHLIRHEETFATVRKLMKAHEKQLKHTEFHLPTEASGKLVSTLQELKEERGGMKTLNLSMAVVFTLTAALFGCGGQAYQTSTGDSSGDLVGSSPTDDSSTSDTDTITESFVADINYSNTLTGVYKHVSDTDNTHSSDTTPFNIETDNKLLIRISAGPAGPVNDPDTNFSATYNCAQFTVTVKGQSQTTKLLAVNGTTGCSGGVESQILDFSSQVPSNHTDDLTVTISNARSDFYCQMWDFCAMYGYWPSSIGLTTGIGSCSSMLSSSRSLYCPSKPLYETHTATFNLEIDTN